MNSKPIPIKVVFLLLSLCSSFAIPLSQAEPPSNPIANSGLEQNGDGWIGYANGEGNTIDFGVSDAEAHTGSQSFKVEITGFNGGNPWDIGIGPSDIPVTANGTFRGSVWVKGPKGTAIDASISLGEPPWTGFGNSGKQTLSGEWQEIAFDVTVGDTESVRMSVQLGYPENNGKTLYFDDAALAVRKVEKSPVSDLDPRFHYFAKGYLVGNRSLQANDPGNWTNIIKNKTGKSNNGKVEVMPDDYQSEGDAIRGEWSRKNMRGEIKFAGPPVDISILKDKAALTFDFKLNRKPNKDVSIGIDCGYPCRAEINVGRQLRDYNTGEWFIFPIPLNCFKSDNFDLTKVDAFFIASEGKMDLSIGKVRMELLPEGVKGCAE